MTLLRTAIALLLLLSVACGSRSSSTQKTSDGQTTTVDISVADPLGDQESESDLETLDDTTNVDLAQSDDLGESPDGVEPTEDQTTSIDADDSSIVEPQQPKLFVGPDDLEPTIVAAINGAKTSIYLTIYQITQTVFSDALIAAHDRGVDVKVITDRQQATVNEYIVGKLTDAGIEVKPSTSYFVYTHSKSLVIDGSTLIVMSMNLIKFSMTTERNYGLIDTQSDHVKDATEVFWADWEYRSPKIDGTDLVVAPQNARQRLLDLVKSATKTLDFQQMQFSDPEFQQAVLEKIAEGVVVRILLATPTWITANRGVACVFDQVGQKSYFQTSVSNHAKLIVADKSRAFIGSVNLSTNSLNNNREIGLISDDADVVKGVLAVYDADWETRAEIYYDVNKSCDQQ
ncbi:MAG: hypothetical protein KC609_16365 [Myxococcales bacterium]|nr:hypothetical protein [Myxococcales bacterium]